MDRCDENFVAEARRQAEAAFLSRKWYCSEAVLRTILEMTGRDVRLTALASGFGAGMGGAGCSCGAVVGGIMALNVFFGRSEPGDPRILNCMKLAMELHDAFRERHRVICCRILNRDVEPGTPEQIRQCARRTADAAELTARILQRELRK